MIHLDPLDGPLMELVMLNRLEFSLTEEFQHGQRVPKSILILFFALNGTLNDKKSLIKKFGAMQIRITLCFMFTKLPIGTSITFKTAKPFTRGRNEREVKTGLYLLLGVFDAIQEKLRKEAEDAKKL